MQLTKLNKQTKILSFTTLPDMTDNIFRELDAGKISVLILLEYSEAFDIINHLIMLYFVGCSIDVIALMCSYLDDICQYVETNKGTSTMNNIHRDVPKGSVLDPLFVLYTIHFYFN